MSSLLIAAMLASTPAPVAACSWNRPGHRAFMGDVVAAVDRYQDIPAPVRAKLKQRMAVRQYDEIVTIGRDAITGRARYGSQIRDMHFGEGQVCGSVDRSGWRADAQERGLVYCEDGHCILVPTVCRNVSRIQREGPAVAGSAGLAGPGGATGAGDAAGRAVATAAAGVPGDGAAAADGGFADGPAVAGVRAESDLGLDGGVAPPAGVLGVPGGNRESAGAGNGPVAGPSFADSAGLGGPLLPSTVPGDSAGPDRGGSTGGAGPGTTVPLGDLSGRDRLPSGGGGYIAPAMPAPTPAVPEPGTALLMLGGLAALLRLRARRRG